MAKSYTKTPPVPPDLQARYQAVLQVLTGETTVSEAARRLGISRNRFQALMNRGLEGLVERLAAQKAGRPGLSPREKDLREQLEHSRAETERLRRQLEMSGRTLGLVRELMAKGMMRGGRGPRKQKAAESSHPPAEDE
jgi:transposase-like protein